MSGYVVKVKYHKTKNKHEIRKIPNGDWIDLYTQEDVDMYAGEYKEISLGISVALPPNFEAIVVPRSSTFKKWGIICANSIGVIDNSYRGEEDIWKFPALCLVGETHIPAGTRIAQFRLLRNQPVFSFETVQQLDRRGRGGIGSTGD